MSKQSKVTILGTSGGIPIEGRAQSGILLESSDTKILFDCGMAVPLRLKEYGVNAEEIDYIFLTHGHLDHIQDLPSLTKASWLRTDEAKFTIVCPPDLVDELPDVWISVGEFERTDLDIQTLAPGEKSTFGDFIIEAFDTPHLQESQGYKIDDGDIIYTGDTAPNPNLKGILKDTKLLIHELSLPMETSLHTHPEGLIDILSENNVERLVLTHFYPQVLENIEKTRQKIEGDTGIKTIISRDLDKYIIEN
ncbi:MAG: MBL fold metallo-hydrolase [Thermoplasmatota archaeon]